MPYDPATTSSSSSDSGSGSGSGDSGSGSGSDGADGADRPDGPESFIRERGPLHLLEAVYCDPCKAKVITFTIVLV